MLFNEGMASAVDRIEFFLLGGGCIDVLVDWPKRRKKRRKKRRRMVTVTVMVMVIMMIGLEGEYGVSTAAAGARCADPGGVGTNSNLEWPVSRGERSLTVSQEQI